MAEGGPLETELKFLVEPGALATLRGHPVFQGPAREERLRSVYFDTPNGDVHAAGLSLRVRKIGGVFVQTVKQCGPSFGFARGEWEHPVPSARPNLPALAGTPAAEALGAGDVLLLPLFITSVRRTSWLWREGPSIVEVALDQGDIRAKDRKTRICEVELELKSGAPEALFNLARELGAAAPMRLSFDSKAQRGYRLALEEAPHAVTATRPEISADISAGEAFRRIARACLVQVAANAESLGRARRPETLHQMRVGLRRFRAAMTAFQPILTDLGFEAVKAESKWLAGELDGARDEDVFIHSTFRQAADRADGDAGFARFGRRLIEVQSGAYDAAMAAIDSPRASGFLIEATRWAEVGGWSRDAGAAVAAMRDGGVRAFAAGALDQLLKSVRKRGRGLGSLDAAGRHKLRIKAKKLRYAAEFLAPAFGRGRRKPARQFLSRLETMQDALGELNDIAVARQKAAEDAGADAAMAFAAGRAVGWRERGEHALIKAAHGAFKDLRDAEPFWRS